MPETDTPTATGRVVRDRRDGGLDEVFLSPRVVDQRAFEVFVGKLRDAAENVEERRASLGRVADKVRELEGTLRSIVEKANDPMDRATKVLERLESTSQRVEAKARALEQRLLQMQDIDAVVTARIDKKLQELDQRLDERFERFVAKLNTEIDAREDALSTTFRTFEASATDMREQAEQATGDVLGGMHAACGAAIEMLGYDPSEQSPQEATGGLSGIVGEAQRLRDELSESLSQSGDARLAVAELARNARGQVTRCREEADELDRRVSQLRSLLADAIEHGGALAAELQHAESRVEQGHAEITERSASIEKMTSELRDLLAAAGEVQERCVETLGTTLNAADRADASVKSLEPWAGVLLRGETGEDSLPDSIKTIIEGVRTEIRKDLADVASAMNVIAGRFSGAAAGDAPAVPSTEEPPIVTTKRRAKKKAATRKKSASED
ncbi:MAG: hypothetical protein AAGD00_08220 [Planctomycetota bacterium]